MLASAGVEGVVRSRVQPEERPLCGWTPRLFLPLLQPTALEGNAGRFLGGPPFRR